MASTRRREKSLERPVHGRHPSLLLVLSRRRSPGTLPAPSVLGPAQSPAASSGCASQGRRTGLAEWTGRVSSGRQNAELGAGATSASRGSSYAEERDTRSAGGQSSFWSLHASCGRACGNCLRPAGERTSSCWEVRCSRARTAPRRVSWRAISVRASGLPPPGLDDVGVCGRGALARACDAEEQSGILRPTIESRTHMCALRISGIRPQASGRRAAAIPPEWNAARWVRAGPYVSSHGVVAPIPRWRAFHVKRCTRSGDAGCPVRDGAVPHVVCSRRGDVVLSRVRTAVTIPAGATPAQPASRCEARGRPSWGAQTDPARAERVQYPPHIQGREASALRLIARYVCVRSPECRARHSSVMSARSLTPAGHRAMPARPRSWGYT